MIPQYPISKKDCYSTFHCVNRNYVDSTVLLYIYISTNFQESLLVILDIVMCLQINTLGLDILLNVVIFLYRGI